MSFIELLKASLVKCGIIDINETPTAEMGVNGLVSLNNLMADWASDGIDIGYYPVVNQDDEVPLAASDLRTVIFNFAIELATDFGVTTSEEVRKIAEETYAGVCKSSRKTFEADMTALPLAEGLGYGSNWFATGGP